MKSSAPTRSVTASVIRPVSSFVSQAPDQMSLGLGGVALLLAIRTLHVDRAQGIKSLNHEIESLSQYPEPDMRRAIRLVLSFLGEDDFAALRDVRDEVEFSILSRAASED